MFRIRVAVTPLLLAMLLLIGWPAAAASAATLTVTTTVDENAGGTPASCSLREAIRAVNQGNSFGGCNGSGFGTSDTIRFNIPDAQADPLTRVRTITLNPAVSATGLPAVTKPVIIDGYSQPDGVVTQASPNTNSPAAGGSNARILIEVTGPTISGPILELQGGSSRIAGLALTLAGNDGSGIRMTTAGGNVIAGNFIGLDAGGTLDRGNTGNGINILPTSPNNTIGGTDPAARNVISGNNDLGIRVQSGGNTIQGNLIGTDRTGTLALGNGQSGIALEAGPDNLVGGDTVNARNVIAANGARGIILTDSDAASNRIEGNYIGLDVTGTTGLGNQVAGIRVQDGAATNTIGGSEERANVISGNSTSGVAFFDAGAGNVVSWNLIGTNAAGTLPLGNGLNGIELHNTPQTTISSNVIAASNEYGIIITDCCSTASVITANTIGTNRNGDAGLGNRLAGIWIEAGTDHQVGGPGANDGNVITANGTDGVRIENTGVTGNSVRRNAIFANGELGIDLATNGRTANDLGDGDTGANERQNFPDLTLAEAEGGATRVVGRLNSTANAAFTIDVYGNDACDSSGFGEGQRFLGSVDVATDDNGNAEFVLNGLSTADAGRVVTSTATDADGNTSELSRCAPVVGVEPPGPVPSNPANNDDEEDELDDDEVRETEEQRQQRERTNRSNRDDYFLEGNVVGLCETVAAPPCVIVANRDGEVRVVLLKDAAQVYGSIRVGDYLEADGEKIHELLFEAESVKVTRPPRGR